MSNIIGNKGSSSEHVHYEAPDSLHSTSYARVLDLVSEGEILGLSAGLQSIYLDDTPLQNADGTMNFENVTVDFRTGTQTQDYIPGFPDVENEVAVGVELKSSAPWVHAISNLDLNGIRLTLALPALSKSDTSNGDVKGYKIDYKMELSTDGGAYVTVLTSSFNGKTTTQYQRSARIDLPAASTGWQVRVTRLTANANVATTSDTTTVVSYTEVIDAKLRYPMSAIVGIQVDAKQFQSVPTRAYDLMGRIIQVPSNYNAKTRAYSGVWDGTFKPSWSDNPAWVFRDIALNDRYGLGHRLTAAQLDKWSLYAIARYCDELVPDGKGGSEPRFTCNVYLQAQKQAYSVLQDLASIFRGISYWGAGSIVASADMPTDPVYVYTAANVIGGKFARLGSSKKTRYTTALVSWNDPADMYKAKVEYVEDAEGITRYGIQSVSLTAFGCTSQGQAQRVGRWALATSRLETEMISFDVGMDGAIALPGQIVRVSDPARMGRRNGGRIKTASGRVVVLDKAPTIAAGDKLTAILPSGKSETHTVVSIAGDAVTVDADWTALPVAQSVWSVDSTVLIAPTYKVVSVTEKDGNTFTISATQHEPGKFAFIENGTAIAPRPESALNSAVQQPPASVTVSAYTVSLQDVQKLGFTASCPVVPGATAYECSFQVDNSNWFNLPRQAGPEFDVLDVLAGYYTVRIAAVNSLGVTSIPTWSAATLVSKNANPKNADILLQLSAPGFNVNADGSITPASITIHATLLDLDGTPSFSAVGGSITSSGNNATLLAANMPGAAATITASITALGQTFTKSIDIVKSADGEAGASNYTWIKYGTSAAGAGLTDNPAGMSYIGIAVNKSSPVESTVASDYAWSLIQGSNGADGASTFTGVVYLQAASVPATPTGGTFNFTTLALTPPAGWSATQPASSTTPTWAVRYNFQAATLGATVTAGKWSDPVNVAQNGANGATGSQTMLAFLYQWNAAAPAAPNGTSTLNWVTGANTNYNGTDNWSVTAPANPGTPGLRLYVATKPVTAAGGIVSTAGISYGSATISAWSQNGNDGASGAQAARATVYQWAATIPAGPSGSATFAWSTGLFGDAPAEWTLAPGAPVPGYTLWAAAASLVDTATAATTEFNWSTASVMAIGYAGGNGQAGASYVTAYSASVTGNANSAPAATTGRSSLPADNSGGIVGTWSKTVPTLTAGQYQYQSDGIYDPGTDKINWSIPYWSSLKVATLSAITANLGSITGGSINLGGGTFTVDNNGNLVCRSVTIYAPDGSIVLQSGVSLAAQTGTNVNLVPRLSDWPVGNRYNGAYLANDTANYPSFKNGEFIVLVSSPDTRYVGYESGPCGIAANLWYTVSFDAQTSNDRDFVVDMFGTNVSGNRIVGKASGHYTFTAQMPSNANGDARLRVYTNGPANSQMYVANVKVELGKVATAWTDDTITATNAAQRVGANAISNTMIGGDLYSTNWNGNYDSILGQGWYLARGGNMFINQLHARGQISGGDYTSYAWVDGDRADGSRKRGYVVCDSGILLGNPSRGGYFQVTDGGDMYMPGFSHVNGQLTLTNTVLIAPKLGNGVSSSMSPPSTGYGVGAGFQFNSLFGGTYTANPVGMGSRLSYNWSLNVEAFFITNAYLSISGNQASLYVTGKLQAGYEGNVQVRCTITDLDSAISTSCVANANFQVQG